MDVLDRAVQAEGRVTCDAVTVFKLTRIAAAATALVACLEANNDSEGAECLEILIKEVKWLGLQLPQI